MPTRKRTRSRPQANPNLDNVVEDEASDVSAERADSSAGPTPPEGSRRSPRQRKADTTAATATPASVPANKRQRRKSAVAAAAAVSASAAADAGSDAEGNGKDTEGKAHADVQADELIFSDDEELFAQRLLTATSAKQQQNSVAHAGPSRRKAKVKTTTASQNENENGDGASDKQTKTARASAKRTLKPPAVTKTSKQTTKRRRSLSAAAGNSSGSSSEYEPSEDAAVESDSDFEPPSQPVQAAASRARGRQPRAPRAPRQPRGTKKIKETANERVARLHPEIRGVWDTLAVAKTFDPATDAADQPKGMNLQLLPFQREGLGWMLHQEQNTEFHGGILADEMGMGKTIQTIALMLSSRSPTKPTLIVVPAVALLQWCAEIQAHTTKDLLRVTIYHGQNRNRDAESLKATDVILTTYSTVETEFRRERNGFQRKGVKTKEKSTLHSIDFYRIVLDEAHHIKDRSSSTTRAALALTSEYKWSLSGTPLQNRVGELYSLVKFLRTDPYSYYFCRQCDCKSLTWTCIGSRTCQDCGHKSMSHFCWWNREILRPISKFGAVGEGLAAYDKLSKLLKSLMLRRTKVQRGSELGLPPRVVSTRRDLFSPEEEDFYEALYSESKTRFQDYVREGTVLNHYAHIFQLLMRMRQAVCHPWLVTHRVTSDADTIVCGICQADAEDPIITACQHTFCREDMRLYLSSSMMEKPACPTCYRPMSVDMTQPTMVQRAPTQDKKKKTSIVNRLNMERWRSSGKVEGLLEELMALRAEDCTTKSIIFSQFTSFLDLLEWRLERAGIRCCKLDGRMSPAQRGTVIDAFNTDPKLGVFLISLKAGGVALNLTAASRVFLMDPWWNPAVEVQAMDRIHRLGQHRPVVVRRMIVENSIESRIDQLQQKKQLLFESTVGGNQSALSRLTEEDMRFLFVL